MNSREFRDSIYNLLNDRSREWIIFGNAHKYENELDIDDINFLVSFIHKSQPTSLGLANLGITDEQICYIAHRLHDNKSLQTLYLPFNKIGDKGAASIADLLAKNTNIQSLNLTSNKIGNFGVAALANMLFNNTHLKEMKLYENAFDEKASNYFTVAMRHNTSITTLLLYPADSGIQLKPRENYAQEQREKMLTFFRKNGLLKKTIQLKRVNSIVPEESDLHRKLITRR